MNDQDNVEFSPPGVYFIFILDLDNIMQVKVTGLRIYGRTNCCSERLEGFTVYVGNSDEPTANTVCAANQPANSAVNPLVEVTCATPVAGSSLYIYLPRFGILTLFEVEVIGRECLTGESSEILTPRVCEHM
jgi:hypothetical protein